MIILGIDPGTSSIGYAVCEHKKKSQLLSADLISISSKNRIEKLDTLHKSIKEVIEKWKPDILSIEKVFFAQNTKTALDVSEARGVILLTARLANLKIVEYTPLEVKQCVTGDGRADKTQMKKMIMLTHPEFTPSNKRDDVYDAIGIALTCAVREKLNIEHLLNN